MKRKTIDIITLGCSKNLVDSEHLMRQLEEVGFHVTHDAERPKGQIAVINTCGFIGDAKEESINMILEFAQAKEEGNLEKLYVMGCLSERYLKELAVEIPQVDKFYGKFNWRELLQDLGKAYHDEVEMTSLLAPIVQVCDAISGARPGARREIVEAYIKRLNDLEQLAMSYPGVTKTYAIQAKTLLV